MIIFWPDLCFTRFQASDRLGALFGVSILETRHARNELWYVVYTELYYITGGPARDKKVSAKTWRILRHFHDNTYFIFMVIATDQPRS